MHKGIYLTLMIGPGVPVPVPQVVLDALTAMQVISTSGEMSGFELTFTLSNRSPLHTLFLVSGGSRHPAGAGSHCGDDQWHAAGADGWRHDAS